jgi:hypothetical protein
LPKEKAFLVIKALQRLLLDESSAEHVGGVDINFIFIFFIRGVD